MNEAASDNPGTVTPTKLVFAGDFIENTTIIPTSNSTMILATALREDDGRAVLLPFIETRVGGVRFGDWVQASQPDLDQAEAAGSDEGDADESDADVNDYEPLLAATLPLDNALFFAWDFVRDIQVACSQASTLSGGRLGLEVTRLKFALSFAEALQEQSGACVVAIERLIAGSEALEASDSAS